MQEEPVEIELRLKQDVDTEARKASDGMNDVAEASVKMKQEFEKNLAAQKKVINDLTAEVTKLKALLTTPVKTDDTKIIQEKEKLTQTVAELSKKLKQAEAAYAALQARSKVAIDTPTGASSANASEDLSENIAIQKKLIAELRAELSALSESFKKVNIGTQDPRVVAEREKLSKVVKQLTAELKAEEKALADLEGKSEAVTQKHVHLETQLRNLREEMYRMKKEGRDNSAEYAEMEKRLGLLGTAHRELAQTQRALASGGAQMAGVLSGLSALSGTLAAGAGAFGLINSESESFQKIQTKVQSLMAITIGLQQISNTLHETSAFRITTVATAKRLWAAASTRLAVAMGISNVAAQALMATLTLGLSVAITAVIAAVSTFTKRQREAAEETKKFNEAVADMAGSTLATFGKLKKGYQDLNGKVQEQTKYLSDNEKEFDSLGVAIDNVNEAERLFSDDGTDDFKKAVMARAKAIAIMEIAAEKYKVVVKKMLEAESMPDTIVKRSPILMPGQTQTSEYRTDNTQKQKLEKEQKEAEAEFDKLIAKAVAFEDEFYTALSGAGKPTGAIADFTKAYWEKQKKDAEGALAAMKDAEKGTAEWNRQIKLYNEAAQKLETWDFKEKKSGPSDDKKDKAGESLRKMAVSLQQEVDAATIAAMQEGAAKQLAETEAAYNKRRDVIEEKLREIEELEKTTGFKSTGQRNLLANVLEAETAKFEAEKKAIRAAAAQEVDSIFADVNQRFTSQLQNQLNGIGAYYSEQMKRLRENVTDTSKFQKLAADLETKRTKEMVIARREYALRTIDFEEDVALRRQEISNRELLWESDKQKKLLEIQIDAAAKRMKALTDIKLSGGDAEKEIASLREELERLNKELDRTNGSKLREIADTLSKSIRKIGSELSSLPGKIGEIGAALTGLANDADNIATIFDKESSNPDRILAGVNGLANLFGMVAGQIAKNKEQQAQWNEKIKEAAHQAALARIELQAYQEGNIFGIENPYAKAIAGATQYKAAIDELEKSAATMAQGQVQTGTTKKVSVKNILGGAGSGASVGAATGTLIAGPVGAAIGAAVGGIIGGITGLFAKKTVPVFESLAKRYGQIYDSKTYELNPQILQDYEKLDAATKKLVDNWQEIRNKALEAEQQMRDTFRDLAGDIGNQLSDALVNAFRNNDLTNALNQFENGVTKMIENIIAQMIFATFFEKMLEDMEEGMMNSFKDGGDGSIIDDLIKFLDSYTEMVPAYNEAMEEARKELRRRGIDAFAPDSVRSATPKGIAQASQDTVDELNGRITNIQQMIYDIRSNGGQSLSVNHELLNHQRMIKGQLDTIAENSEHLKRLEKIENSLSDISLKGVKIKQ